MELHRGAGQLRRSPRSSARSAPFSRSSPRWSLSRSSASRSSASPPRASAARSSATTTFGSSSPTRPGSRSSASGSSQRSLGAVPLARNPAAVPVALLAVAPFRVPVQVGDEDASFSFRCTSSSRPRCSRSRIASLRGERPPRLRFLLGAAARGFRDLLGDLVPVDVGRASRRYRARVLRLSRSSPGSPPSRAQPDRRAGCPARCSSPSSRWARSSRRSGSGRRRRGRCSSRRDVEVANAYTSFFRVTSLFKDPSLYGRYLVMPIAVLLVAILIRRGRTVDWVVATAFVAFLFFGLFYSYSQSSFVALFVVTFGVALVGVERRTRIVLLACALVVAVAAGSRAAASIGGRSAKDVTSGRSRLVRVTLDAFKERPIAGVGVGGQPRASSELAGKGSPSRNASHTTPLTVLPSSASSASRLYVWPRRRRLGARPRHPPGPRARDGPRRDARSPSSSTRCCTRGFFEDPLTWGVLGLAAAVLAARSPQVVTRRLRRKTRAGCAGAAGTLIPAGATGLLMPRAFVWIIAAVAVARRRRSRGLSAASWFTTQDRRDGTLDTELQGVTVSDRTTTAPQAHAAPEPAGDRRCWLTSEPIHDARSPARPRSSDSRPEIPLDARPRELHRVPAGLLRRRPLRQLVRAARPTRSTRRRGRSAGSGASEERCPSSPAIDGPRS